MKQENIKKACNLANFDYGFSWEVAYNAHKYEILLKAMSALIKEGWGIYLEPEPEGGIRIDEDLVFQNYIKYIDHNNDPIQALGSAIEWILE